ncbi:hypothetical protein ZYGR_0N02430 [Zygosaccharomyces rouxii]|uniref:ZYRO0D05874p n=2 Tax=Zygosaccharomyces rouxii TaxID=4956 RepID=C5DVD8_ZYGRC|nr:uncharacterized protein ZYRO0D05874g [Zygosaccharomyces rouxii]KAH9200670.1 hypothetical protein LQ764DRAFT_224166 [Zygosaccharomyces rouxii]GAV48838.1 hypothetical protein ZYGR_0N02430 [Zygosaccharomyces rouxii]CAR27757.1 ZYRO0D05874p [Zygosaccharomyces rouxii]
MDSKQNVNIPLPENVELLSSGEILGLLKEHRNQLQSYVTKFHPQDELKQEVNELRSQLQSLESKFQGLEDERSNTQRQLEECRIMEAQYVKLWQDLRQRIMEKYHDDALKKQLEVQIQHLDDASGKLEMDMGKYEGLDEFLNDYIGTRTQYHLKREKLTTWIQQGELKM